MRDRLAKRHKVVTALAIGLSMLVICSTGFARDLVLGTVSTRPEYHIVRLQPMVDYAASRLKDQGITRGQVLLAKDAEQLDTYFVQGRIDWVGVTIAAASNLQARKLAKPMLLALDSRGRNYRALYFVKRGSPIRDLLQLRGKRLALRSNSSTSSFFVPLMQLQDLNQPFQLLSSLRTAVPTDQVGVLISGSETNSALWVYHGLSDVGVANSLDWQDPQLFPESLRAGLDVIAESSAVPLGVELFSTRMDVALAERLKSVLLAAEQDDAGRQAMRSYSNTLRFELISAQLQKDLSTYTQRFSAIKSQLP